MWRCPHCGTPQAETARCWVCHRSSTACGTCRHFRRSVAVQLGYCGLDRNREPLTGDEIRACWEARPAAEDLTEASPAPAPASDHRDRLEFVEVGASPESAATTTTTTTTTEERPIPVTVPAGEPGWSLWGDLER